jgi:hypothetical protein
VGACFALLQTKQLRKILTPHPKEKNQLHVSIIPFALKNFYVLHYLWPFLTWVNDKGCE